MAKALRTGGVGAISPVGVAAKLTDHGVRTGDHPGERGDVELDPGQRVAGPALSLACGVVELGAPRWVVDRDRLRSQDDLQGWTDQQVLAVEPVGVGRTHRFGQDHPVLHQLGEDLAGSGMAEPRQPRDGAPGEPSRSPGEHAQHSRRATLQQGRARCWRATASASAAASDAHMAAASTAAQGC